MFGKEAFAEGLRQLGHAVEDRGGPRVSFSHTIGGGRFKDTTVTIGIEVPSDFNVTPPTGPHITPRLIPINTNALGNDRAAESSFGPEWQYLSRPFRDGSDGWNRTKRDVKAYLRHIRNILETL